MCDYIFKCGSSKRQACGRVANYDGRCREHKLCNHGKVARNCALTGCGCKHGKRFRDCVYRCKRVLAPPPPPTPIMFDDESEDIAADSDTEDEATIERIMVDVLVSLAAGAAGPSRGTTGYIFMDIDE